ncbi:hypothetical protein [Dictyobacter halimunensis]|uniref:hypothetical protein n=1 Tax=Dictyobacter halimunensis TaxID=3026934 RepID=UPI0030C740A9
MQQEPRNIPEKRNVLPEKRNARVESTFNGRPGCQRQRRQPTSPRDTASPVFHVGPRGTRTPTYHTRPQKHRMERDILHQEPDDLKGSPLQHYVNGRPR